MQRQQQMQMQRQRQRQRQMQRQRQEQRQKKKQIPFGNDRKKSNGKSKGGMGRCQRIPSHVSKARHGAPIFVGGQEADSLRE
jgi:hypothetical protein